MKEYSLNQFLNLILPNEDVIFKEFNVPYKARTNSIKWVKTILLGDSGSGKTELARLLVEQCAKRYTPTRLEAIVVPRNMLDDFFNMPYMLPGKPIKAIFFDDSADHRFNARQMDTWHRMRHVVKERTKQQNGLILSFIASQDYYSLNIGLRRSYHCLLAKDGPENEKDERDFRKFFTDEGLRMLQKYAEDKLHGTQECEFAVFRAFGRVGWFRTPPAEHDYLEEFKYLG